MVHISSRVLPGTASSISSTRCYIIAQNGGISQAGIRDLRASYVRMGNKLDKRIYANGESGSAHMTLVNKKQICPADRRSY